MFLSVHTFHDQARTPVLRSYNPYAFIKACSKSFLSVIVHIEGLRGTFRASQTLKEVTFLTQNVQLRPSWNRKQLDIGRVPSLLIYYFTNCAALVTSSGFQFLPIMTVVTNFISEALGSQSEHTTTKKDQQNLETKFRLYTDTAESSCQIFVNQLDTLDKCSFNASLPLVMIVHGWSV